MNDIYIIITAILVAVNCAILGSFLLLRKMTMVADAISHAVLPGIVIAFLLAGNRESVPMFAGAALLGILTTLVIEFLHQKARLATDASIGITFTWMFAMGVILISLFAGKVDLDQDCVLYGEIAYVPLDLWLTEAGVNLGPRALYINGSVLVLILAFITLCWKELKLTTFDPAFATAIGIQAWIWHYALMGAVSLTTVASFESVGAILVVALMVVPAATAYLITRQLIPMLLMAAFFGTLASVTGFYLAVWLDGSIAGGIATMAGVWFILVFMLHRLRLVTPQPAFVQKPE